MEVRIVEAELPWKPHAGGGLFLLAGARRSSRVAGASGCASPPAQIGSAKTIALAESGSEPSQKRRPPGRTPKHLQQEKAHHRHGGLPGKLQLPHPDLHRLDLLGQGRQGRAGG